MRHKANIIRDQVLRRGVTLKQGEDGGGPRGRTKWVDLWNVMPPSSLEFHYCQRHIAFHFASIIHEIHIFFQNLIRRVAKPCKILSQRPMLISIINSLIAPKVWWFSVLWWGPTKRLCNGIETACEAVSPLTQLHHYIITTIINYHHHHQYPAKSQESSACTCHFWHFWARSQ